MHHAADHGEGDEPAHQAAGEAPADLDAEHAHHQEASSRLGIGGELEEHVLEGRFVGVELGDPELLAAERLGHAGRLAGRAGRPRGRCGSGVAGMPASWSTASPAAEVGHRRRGGVVRWPRWSTSSTVPVRHAAAPGEDGDPVAGVLDLGEEVAGHEHRPALVAERAEELADLLDARRGRGRWRARRG